jgi:hypothetical protein
MNGKVEWPERQQSVQFAGTNCEQFHFISFQLRNSYDAISNKMGGFSESVLAVLTNTLNQDLSDYVGPDVELAASPVDNAEASATQLTCLQLQIPDALTRS